MANDFNCKKCGSPDTKTFKMLYEQGSSNGTFGGVSSGVGVGVGLGGMGVGVNAVGFSGSMSNANLLAERTRPPERKAIDPVPPNGWAAVIIFGVLFSILILIVQLLSKTVNHNNFFIFGGFGLSLIVIGVYFGARDLQKKMRQL